MMLRGCLCLALLVTACSCWWPFSDDSPEATASPEPSAQLETRTAVPFEMMTAEQKFLAQAQQFLDLPPLDKCQNQVIAKLRTSCGEVNEEELGKLSVALLNCQSQSEGRPTFPCTDGMTLAECTRPMDAHLWNAYHIISNRARSVCYATRQQQFRRQTEAAVNMLSHSTLEQLQAVNELSTSHEEIRKVAEDSLQTMERHQGSLVEHQEQLLSRHQGLTERVSYNLQQLTQEKTLIHAGQEQLTNMTQDIRNQLEEAWQVLDQQEQSRKEGHQEILSDISDVRGNIREVWERLDNSTTKLLGVLDDISTQYQSTLENLHLINSSVTNMLGLVAGMDAAVSSRLEWLVAHMGGTQDGLRVLTTCATHACFLLIATLCVLFIKAPAVARIALLLLVVGNVIAEVKFRASLSLTVICALEAAILICNWLFLYLHQRRAGPVQYHLGTATASQALTMGGVAQPGKSSPLLEDDSFSDFETEADFIAEEKPGYSFMKAAETVTHTPTKITDPPRTPLRLPISTPRSTPRPPGRQCTALTRNGLQCRLTATPGSYQCFRHSHN